MLSAFIIVFREVIEAGLIVGIVLAATRGVPHRARPIAGGIALGLFGAGVVAVFAGTIANLFEGSGQEFLNATILLFAVVMLTWHNVWMAHHGRELAIATREIGNAVASGQRPLAALGIVVGLAVLREGSEVVLFLYGVALSAGSGLPAMLAGCALGLAAGAALAAASYGGLVKLPTRYLFRVTSVLIALLAAGMASQAVVFLSAGGFIDGLGRTLWNTSALLPQASIAGRMLQTLIGYSEAPTVLQIAVYAATLGTIFLLMRIFAAPAPTRPARTSSAA